MQPVIQEIHERIPVYISAEYRVERSLEFLLSSDDSIMEVAQKSGFTDSNYYAKVFSRVKGCSPQKYRKQNIRKDM